MLEKNIYDKIKEIINIPDERIGIPQIMERIGVKGKIQLIIDIPKREKAFYHSSTYTVDCDENNKKCNFRGGIITKLGNGNEIKKKLEKLTCDVLDIHNHHALSAIKSTHVHFKCDNKSYDDTVKITKFLKEY